MSLLQRMQLFTIGCFLSLNAFANEDTAVLIISDAEDLGNRWSVIANLGYTEYQHTQSAGSETALGRLALAAEMLTTNQASFGLEFGMQSGNRMRLAIPQGTLTTLGTAVRTSVKPMLDLLVTAHANPVNESLLFTQIKGGIAYRHWQIDSIFVNNKSEISGEFQAGFGYPLTEITNLNLLYQGIFGGNPKIHANPSNYTAYIARLPVQHGILLGFSIIA